MARKPATKRARDSATFRWLVTSAVLIACRIAALRFGVTEESITQYLPPDGVLQEIVDASADIFGYVVDIGIAGTLKMAWNGRRRATQAIQGF